LLAAYDLGASSEIIQAIYDQGVKPLEPIQKVQGEEVKEVVITRENWKEYLGSKDGPSPFVFLSFCCYPFLISFYRFYRV
jgi:predicted DNA-binding antitoxin AbrB/MazE fold protein